MAIGIRAAQPPKISIFSWASDGKLIQLQERMRAQKRNLIRSGNMTHKIYKIKKCIPIIAIIHDSVR